MTPENKAYVEAQQRWLRKVKPRKGDQFTVLARAESLQAGWADSWTQDMDRALGRTVQFIRIADNPDEGLVMHLYGETWNYPFFVLGKV